MINERYNIEQVRIIKEWFDDALKKMIIAILI